MIKENGIAGDEAADGGGVMSKNIGRRRIWFWVLALAFLAVSICLLLQVLFHLFNGPLNDLRDYLSTANGIIYSRMALGISVGTVIVLAVLLVFPILIHNINTRSYFKGLYRGVISAAIFYFSKSLYAYLSSFSQLYMLLSMLVVVVITFMLIQAVAKMHKREEDQIEFRTSFIASITAGLLFGVLLQLITVGVEVARHHFNLRLFLGGL